MSSYKLVRIRPSAGVDSVQVHRKMLAFQVAGQTYVTTAPAGLASGFKKSVGWYKVPTELADLFDALTFGGSTFLDVMAQEEAKALEAREGGPKAMSIDTAQAAECDAQVRLSQISAGYEVHPTNWPMCLQQGRWES